MAAQRFYNGSSYNSFRPYKSHRHSRPSHQARSYSTREEYNTSSKWIKKSVDKEIKDKSYYRSQVWNYMENNNIAMFPRPVYHRIPNFVGADDAAFQLQKLECFKKAKIVKVNPDKPQQNVRYLCLKMGKRLLIPTPQLRSHGLLNEIVIPSHLRHKDKTLQMAGTRKGLQQFGRLLSLNTLLKEKHKYKVDICIVGSVAVDKTNGYRIGKGEGFADIEIAVMNELGLIDLHTVFIATVHNCQVFESLNAKLFTAHDVRLDYIVTPTQIIKIDQKRQDALPYKIDWNKLSQQRLNSMPILKHLRDRNTHYNAPPHVKRW